MFRKQMELKFDAMEVNTRLAEDFLTTHKAHLQKILSSKDVVMDLQEFTNIPIETQFDDINLQLEALASKVQEHAELIAELEVLKRGKLKEDVLNFDLKLIVDNFKYWSSKQITNRILQPMRLQNFHNSERPLAALGYIAESIMTANKILIICNSTTLPVIYMFARLFRQVGLNLIAFKYTEVNTAGEKFYEDWNGCTAVISEYADVDSAVDALLASTSHKPWQLHRIYVQESVYKNVKSALSWKCRPKKSPEAGDDKVNDSLDFANLQYSHKKLIFDYPESSRDSTEKNKPTFTELNKEETQTIFVEAYRTAKELLSLLQKDNSFCLSLWSSDVSESNEIAFNVKAPLVWVNDIGALDGPAHVSQTFYTNFSLYDVRQCNDKVAKLRESWSKLTPEERAKKVINALQNTLESRSDDQSLRATVQKLKQELIQRPGGKFFENTKGKMWINMEMPNGMVACNESSAKDSYFELFKSAVRGNILLYIRWNEDTKVFHELCKANFPFIMEHTESHSSEKSVNEKVYNDLYRNRTIVINYGTIFAN